MYDLYTNSDHRVTYSKKGTVVINILIPWRENLIDLGSIFDWSINWWDDNMAAFNIECRTTVLLMFYVLTYSFPVYDYWTGCWPTQLFRFFDLFFSCPFQLPVYSVSFQEMPVCLVKESIGLPLPALFIQEVAAWRMIPYHQVYLLTSYKKSSTDYLVIIGNPPTYKVNALEIHAWIKLLKACFMQSISLYCTLCIKICVRLNYTFL